VYVRTSPLGGAHAAGIIIASTRNFATCYWQSVSSILDRGALTMQVSHVTKCLTQPFPHSVCVLNEDGRQEVFWTGTSTTETNPGPLMHQWQTSSGTWSGKASLGGSVYNWIDVGVNGDGRLEVFGQNSSHALQHMYQLAPNGVGGWHSFASLGCPASGCLNTTSAPTVTYPGGQMCVGGMRGTDGHIHSIGQVMANGGWKAWDAGC
jgi:hypothetical protein